ncbi:uncharacterized protein [Euwallacea fornicatus]|uniref:uncharacterized protein isoform X1 n=1 Tax=Euwallacea fornicatus TaxID=995702 RepID=UPI00338E18DB
MSNKQSFTQFKYHSAMNHIGILIFHAMATGVGSIWVPEYEINLQQDEEFLIPETLEWSDVEDIYEEEELIRDHERKALNLPDESLNSDKYYRLHSMSRNKNFRKEQGVKLVREGEPRQNFPELRLAKPEPWIAGFVDETGNIIKNEDTIYFADESQSANSTDVELVKREIENEKNDSDYNYESLKSQYDESMKIEETREDTAKYKEVKEKESPNEAVKNLFKVAAQNCTDKESTSLGIGDVKCVLLTSGQIYLKKDAKYYFIKKVLLIVTIWALVYVVIAVPLWCQYGWCCCCCRFKFCNPRSEIDEIKTFCANNPPGVYYDEGTLRRYQPTTYEIHAHRELEKMIEQL